MALILNGDGSIQSLVAGGLPTGTVTQATLATPVAGTGPAFSAYSSVQQTLASATSTKLNFITEEFDTNSNYDTTLSRFTPTVSGYYQVSAGMQIQTSITPIDMRIFKNGSVFKNLQITSTASVTAVSGSALIYFNGTTDYVEVYASIGTGQNVAANQQATYFQAVMVRGA